MDRHDEVVPAVPCVVLLLFVCHVVSADTINTFKDRLDKFLANQDVLYDYKSGLRGIGNRSVIYDLLCVKSHQAKLSILGAADIDLIIESLCVS